MFGLGFGEMVLILIVGIVVVGPRRLPTLMRTAGQWVGKLRRMSSELRSQSGIDELIRQEGLEKEINELRALSRVNVIDTLVAPALSATAPRPRPSTSYPPPKPAAPPPAEDPEPSTPAKAPAAAVQEPLREREYPVVGPDAEGITPDDDEPYPAPAATKNAGAREAAAEADESANGTS